MPTRIVFPILGLAVAAAILGMFLFANRGSHIEIKGEILKVRTHSAEESACVAILDFRFVNPARYPFQVRSIDVTAELADGKKAEGMVIADSDAKRYLQNYPAMGQKYNDSLVIRERIAPKQSLDKMVMARFEVPESALQARRGLRIRVEEVDGAVSELVEKTSK